MRSVGVKGTTLLTIITLILTPIFDSSGNTVWKVSTRSKQVTTVQCVAGQPCPAKLREIVRFYSEL